jgi:hypothetical protein
MGTLHEDLCAFMIASLLVLRRMRNVSDKSCKENQTPHFMLNNVFPRKLCLFLDNVEIYG